MSTPSLCYLQIALSAILAVASGLAVTHLEVHTHLLAGDNQDYSFLKYMKDEVCRFNGLPPAHCRTSHPTCLRTAQCPKYAPVAT